MHSCSTSRQTPRRWRASAFARRRNAQTKRRDKKFVTLSCCVGSLIGISRGLLETYIRSSSMSPVEYFDPNCFYGNDDLVGDGKLCPTYRTLQNWVDRFDFPPGFLAGKRRTRSGR